MGGNVKIGDVEADRINLNHYDRDELAPILFAALKRLNNSFKKTTGLELWNNELFKSKEFLSGSSFHFFNYAIPTTKFRSKKPTVGDIDVQVDKNLQPQIIKWLDSNPGKLGPIEFVGYKKSPGQLITLWTYNNEINIQIDLELVDFQDGRPTQWARFSHSSAWEDIEHGIKGVFHKYALRALSTKSLRDVIILKGKKETPKKTTVTDLAFSVTKGLRYKLQAVRDEKGNIKKIDGLEVYKEISTDDSKYYTVPDEMFRIFFNKQPSAKELELFHSFVGIVQLVRDNWSKADQRKFVLGFANTLWGQGAQKISRTSPDEDFAVKMGAYKHLLKQLGIEKENPEIKKWRIQYYESY